MRDGLYWKIMVVPTLVLFLLLLSSCIIRVDTEKNSLVFVPRLQQQRSVLNQIESSKNRDFPTSKLLCFKTNWDSKGVLAVDINRIESISISSQELSHSTAIEVRRGSRPHRHHFLKLERRKEKEADEEEEVFRHKRFYPMHVNIGCVKGYKCCTDARCKPFCTLCYGKNISLLNLHGDGGVQEQ